MFSYLRNFKYLFFMAKYRIINISNFKVQNLVMLKKLLLLM